MSDLFLHDFPHGAVYEHAVWEKGAHWDGERWHGLVAACGIGHSSTEPVALIDCPVASRWTIIHAGRTAATATLDPHAPEGARSAVDVQGPGDE